LLHCGATRKAYISIILYIIVAAESKLYQMFQKKHHDSAPPPPKNEYNCQLQGLNYKHNKQNKFHNYSPSIFTQNTSSFECNQAISVFLNFHSTVMNVKCSKELLAVLPNMILNMVWKVLFPREKIFDMPQNESDYLVLVNSGNEVACRCSGSWSNMQSTFETASPLPQHYVTQ
jgi:hypothetical protein